MGIRDVARRAGEFTGVLSRGETVQSTGFAHQRRRSNPDEYASLRVYTLFERFFAEILNNIAGLDPDILTAAQNNRQGSFLSGFMRVIVDGGGRGNMAIVDTAELTEPYTGGEIANIIFVGFDPEGIDPSRLIPYDLDARRLISALTTSYIRIHTAHERIGFILEASNMALMGLEGLRDNAKDSATRESIKGSVAEVIEKIKEPETVLVMDAGDRLTFPEVSIGGLRDSIDAIYSEMAGILLLPKTVLTGAAEGGLASAGDGSRKQYYSALEALFARYLKPLLMDIQHAKRGSTDPSGIKFVDRASQLANIDAAITSVNMLSLNSLLTTEQQKQLTEEIFRAAGLQL